MYVLLEKWVRNFTPEYVAYKCFQSKALVKFPLIVKIEIPPFFLLEISRRIWGFGVLKQQSKMREEYGS